MTKRILAVLLSLCLLLALPACGGGRDPAKDFAEAVRVGEYEKAAALYRERIAGNAALESAAQDLVVGYAQSQWQAYATGELSEDALRSLLLTLQRLEERLGLFGELSVNLQQQYAEVSASREAFAQAEAYERQGLYPEAMLIYEQVSSLDRQHYDAAAQARERCREQYIQQLLGEAERLLSDGDYAGAAALLQNGEAAVGADPRLTEALQRVQTAEFEVAMMQLAAAEDFPALCACYQRALDNPNCSIRAEMTQLYTEQSLRYRDRVIQRSVSAYREGGYASAIPVIAEGLALLPEDTELQRYRELYDSCIPVSLAALSVVESRHYEDSFSRAKYDIDGREYSDGVEFYGDKNDTAYCEWALNRSYTAFTAVFFANTRFQKEGNTRLVVYADGVEIFDSGFRSRTDEPLSISLDVTGVSRLRMELSWDKHLASEWLYADLASPILSRILTEAELTR